MFPIFMFLLLALEENIFFPFLNCSKETIGQGIREKVRKIRLEVLEKNVFLGELQMTWQNIDYFQK